jgi:hypothetical protein
MLIIQNFDVAVVSADVMAWPLQVAGPAAPAAHPAGATHVAIPANKRRTAAATVASVYRGPS